MVVISNVKNRYNQRLMVICGDRRLDIVFPEIRRPAPLEGTTMRLPVKIDPCPITEAIIEIRFDTSKPEDAVFALVYNAVQDRYPQIEKTPLHRIPEDMRREGSGLAYKPIFRLSSDSHLLQVGPRVVSVIVQEPYRGWNDFSSEILRVFTLISGLGIIDSVSRLGIRYSNFFGFDIFSKINLSVALNNEPFFSEETTFKAVIPSDSFRSTLLINNTTTHVKRSEVGSIIDIDTFSTDVSEEFFERAEKLITEGHQVEKELFFSLLKPEFLETLNPEWAEV